MNTTVLIALGVPGGRIMLSHAIECQVLLGHEVGLLSEEEYQVWNHIRYTPYPIDQATDMMHRLVAAGVLYAYDPTTPDRDFMRRYRVVPMGRLMGPIANSPRRYQILSTDGVQPIVCDDDHGRAWMGWWRRQPLSAPPTASLKDVWAAIPWALSHNLGYLVPWEGVAQ